MSDNMILQLHHREGCVLITITTKSSFIITTPREHLTMNRRRKRKRKRRRRRKWVEEVVVVTEKEEIVIRFKSKNKRHTHMHTLNGSLVPRPLYPCTPANYDRRPDGAN